METSLREACFDYGTLTEAEIRYFNREIEAIAEESKSVIRSSLNIGRRFAAVQERLARPGVGSFGDWVEMFTPYTRRHALNLINAFRLACSPGWERLVDRMDDTSLFTIAAPSCPEKARNEVKKIVERGEFVRSVQTKKIVEKHSKETNFPEGYSPHGKPKSSKPAKPKKDDHSVDVNKKVDEPKQQQELITDGAAEDRSELGSSGSPEPEPEGVVSRIDAESADPSGTIIETTCRTITEEEPIDTKKLLIELVARGTILARKLDRDDPAKSETLAHLDSLMEVLTGGEATLVRASVPVPITVEGKVAAIYEAYPKKVAKGDALKAIEKALKRPDVTYERLLEAVTEYAKSRQGKDQKYTPHPATWFNRCCWEDDRMEWWRSDKPRDGFDEFVEQRESGQGGSYVEDMLWGKAS